MKPALKLPASKFTRVTCDKCGNQQIIFNKPSTTVKCLKCGDVIATTTGGIAEIKGKTLDMRG